MFKYSPRKWVWLLLFAALLWSIAISMQFEDGDQAPKALKQTVSPAVKVEDILRIYNGATLVGSDGELIVNPAGVPFTYAGVTEDSPPRPLVRQIGLEFLTGIPHEPIPLLGQWDEHGTYIAGIGRNRLRFVAMNRSFCDCEVTNLRQLPIAQ